MAYKPTGTFIPCTTNGFIIEEFSKSYKISIAKPARYPGEENVYGVIWIVDIGAMSKKKLEDAKYLAGSDLKKDPTGNTKLPFENNYYSFANLYSFPEKNPKDGSELYDPWRDIENRDGVKRIRLSLDSSLWRVQQGELSAGYSVDDFINLNIKYLQNAYKDIVYGRKKEIAWTDAAKKYDDKKISESDLLKIYEDIGKKPENQMSLKVDGDDQPKAPEPNTDTAATTPASNADNGSPSAPPAAPDPTKITGKFTLKVKSGPGVIIGVTEVDIVGGKADFSGIQFDQAGDYVVTVSSTSPEVGATDLNFKVLPPPEAIPQDPKGSTASEASGTRPIIAQIDPPTIKLKSMIFNTEGSPADATSQVVNTIGTLPFVNFSGSVINDRDIQQLRLYHDGILPKVKLTFRDSNNLLSSNPPQDDTKFEVFINPKSHNLKYIHLMFKVEDYQKMQNNLYSVTGAIDISELYRMKFKVYRGTSFNAIRNICKDLNIGFNSNIENTADEMPWRNIGDRPYKFIGDIIKHSYISDDSFMAGYIDYYYCFNYVDIEKEMKRDISKDVGIETGGISDKKEEDKIVPLMLSSEKGQQTSSFFFIKTGQKSDSTKISMQQGYKTRTKFYDKVKKMFLVFDVDSTTSDESKSIILKGAQGDKESFDNNYVTKYSGKIDTDNVHKNHNYAVTQNRINLDNMMKNQMDIKLPNPNFNVYKYQKVLVTVIKEAATVTSEEMIEWRYSGEWLILDIAYEYSGGKLSQEIKLIRKEMGKNPEEIRNPEKKQAPVESKDPKNENPIVGTASETITNKPNGKYKAGDVFTVQDANGVRYVMTISKLSENGTDVIATLKDPNAVPNQVVTGPDTITGVTQSTEPIASTASATASTAISGSASGVYPYRVTLERIGGEDGELNQSLVTERTNDYRVLTRDGNIIDAETNVKDEKSMFIAIKIPLPTYKPEDSQKSMTPFNWVLFEINDYGIESADMYGKNGGASINKRIYQGVKYRIFNGREAWGHAGSESIEWGPEEYNGKVPKGSIKIYDESRKVVLESTDTSNTGFSTGSSLTKGGFSGTPPKYEYDRWFAFPGDGSPTASVLVDKDQEWTSVGGSRNTIYYDLSDRNRYKPGTYTIEIKYYVPIYEKINADGDNRGKAYNGTGTWDTKEKRLTAKETANPYEEKTLTSTFTIAKKSKKR